MIIISLTSVIALPCIVHADSAGKTVRVGWYESPFNITGESGRKSGYAYEYQQKIAAYTGWDYYYVTGSWPELMQKLIDGEIDLMSDVSYTPERTEQMLFSNLSMGAEEYYIFAMQGNTDILQDDPQSLNNKRIGVNKGSVQVGYYRDWAKQHGVNAELVELTGGEEESMELMREGKIDAYISLDVYNGWEDATPVFKVGSSDFFFAVNKDKPELLSELNAAMNKIHSENRYYEQQLSQKYITSTGANLFLGNDEAKWLSEHKVIRVGYQDDYLAFCDTDANGNLTGALKDYLEDAASCFKNARLDFEPVAYPSAEEALEALKNGEIDCLFPSNLDASDGENYGIIMTPATVSTELCVIVKNSRKDSFSTKDEITVAIPANDPNREALVRDNFPEWKMESFPDRDACLKAVYEGKTDCILISNFQYNSLTDLCEKYSLTMLSTGDLVDYYFAVKRGSKELYSILTRTTNLVNRATVNAALNHYSAREIKISFADFIKQNPGFVIAVVIAVFAIFIFLFIQRRLFNAQKNANENRHNAEDLEKQVYVDALTHARNKEGYDNYITQLQKRIDEGETIEAAIGVFDCDNLKEINDQHGKDKGNVYLQTACDLICRTFEYSPVFRTGGDEFIVVLMDEDLKNKNRLVRKFEESQKAASFVAKEPWEKICVSFAIAVYDPEVDQSLEDLGRRADKLMYENKLSRKERSK